VDLVALAVLIAVAAFFTFAESVLEIIGPQRARKLSEEGKRAFTRFADAPERMLTSLRFGKCLACVAVLVLMIVVISSDSPWLAFGAASATLFLLGELVPRSLARGLTRQTAGPVLIVLKPWFLLVNPLSALFERFARLIEPTSSNLNPSSQNIYEENLELLIDGGVKHGSFQELEGRILQSVIDFGDTIVREVMVPRTEVVACDIDTAFEEVLRLCVDEGYSRVPVYRETVDEIVGIFYAKDLLAHITQQRRQQREVDGGFSLESFLRDPYFVPETKHIRDLFKEFQREHIHIAIVVDEFGGTAGMVTLEDIIEELFGEIQDEFDSEEEPIEILGEAKDHAVVDARTHVDEIEELFDTSFPEDADYDSVGGFVVAQLGRLPSVGEEVLTEDLCYTVTQADAKRVIQVEIRRVDRGAKSSAA
jgi:CBS domain containing-hemolysin-like protein